MIGRRGSRPRSARATAACPTYTSAGDDHRRRMRGNRRRRSSSAATPSARRRSRRSATYTISTGAASARTSLKGCSPQRYWAARNSTSRSRIDTQAFGADRLRRCAQLSHSVALAASCAPHRPQSEYTRTPCGVTSRRIGRSIVTRNGSELAAGTAGARRKRRHPAQERTRLINSRRDCMARSLQRLPDHAPARSGRLQ